VIAAGLLARNANALGLTRKPWVKTSLAPGSKAVQLYLEEAGCCRAGAARLRHRRLRLHHLQRHERRAGSAIQQEIIDRDLYATAVLSGNRNFDGRIHPYAKQAFLASPPLVVAYAIAGTVRFDIEKDVLGIDADGKDHA
jgi:aconitase A